ncbi:MAG: efflux RND transporter permease subunit, partial [Kiloniellales bacterium]|nr:efflux RND transporter permease subunit [Kiloniellales bacterium]
MNPIKTSIERPIAVISAVLMVVMFGLVALDTIPIQLTPDVNSPVITVRTDWFSAAPAEIEREITNRQEEVLTGIPGLTDIISRSEQGRAQITLEFEVGTNMDRALLLVSNRLDRVTGYPDEADEPTLKTAGSEDNAIAWFIITRQDGNERPVHEYGDFVEDVVKDRLERVPGVGEVNVYGGSEREIQIIAEPQNLARYGLTVTDVLTRLRAANTSISAGDVEEGKRRWVARVEGELNDLSVIKSVVLRSLEDPQTGEISRVTVADVAKVKFAHKEPVSTIRLLGEAALAMNAKREVGANVIEVMEGIQAAIEELNAFSVPDAGLKLKQVYRETVYINSAIELVRQNIWVGGSLAAVILLIFLRSVRATLVVSLAIPVSVIGSFVAMAALGRSINVISLAGLAFAVGMVVDAAIVVLENIYRLREQGKTRREAAYEGAKQVWGAVFVSALTTVMVFIPILIMELEVGQLFRDIAVAISVSVLLSLVVSVTVLPALASRLLPKGKPIQSDQSSPRQGIDRPLGKRLFIPLIDHLAKGFVWLVMAFVGSVARSKILALLVVAVTTAGAGYGAWKFLPKLEYLPDGNRNLMFGIVIPPPGYNLDTMTEIAKNIEGATKPYWGSLVGFEDDPNAPPKIDRFFFVAFRATTFIGAAAVNPQRAAELRPILENPVYKEPGTFALINQLSLFGRGFGGGRKIELDISGPSLETNVAIAGQAAGRILSLLPNSEGNQFRPNPGLELGAPEIRLTPNRLLLADNGISAIEFGNSVDTFNDGLRVAEITVGSKRLDLMLKGPENMVSETQGIGQLPIVTSDGLILPADSLSDIVLTSGPTEIRHRDRARTITLEIVPRQDLPLQQALEMIQAEVIAPMQEQGLPPGVKMRISGTADKLTLTWNAMVRDLLIAIVIVYLVMAVLFESFIYPIIIMLSVPLAAAGGVAGLAALNTYTFQALDMLTLLGFVILVGIVVNNAILLVHQTLFHLRQDGLAADEAIKEATRNRIRPIFMSTLTSVVGMLPLVLFPGAGSELYRGLGSV